MRKNLGIRFTAVAYYSQIVEVRVSGSNSG